MEHVTVCYTPGMTDRIEIIKDGAWWVVINGRRISDHSTRTAAATTANRHIELTPKPAP